MGQTCQEPACDIRALCAELNKMGCRGGSTWLAILLFVRDLVRHFSLFSENEKQVMQHFVFGELARRDPSERHLRQILDGLEELLGDNAKTAALSAALASEKAAANALAVSIGDFVRESLTSEQERGKLLRCFGHDVLETLGSGAGQSVMLPRLRTLVTDMLVHYREEAQAWERKANQLEKAMRVDPLLAPLFNRRCLDDHLEGAIAASREDGTPLSLLMIDVDHFKTGINDVYGHTVGDDVLRALAKIINDHASRHGWFAARYGGDELVLACPLTGEAAAVHADAIRLAVQHYEFRPRLDGRLADAPLRFTISIGVAAYQPGMAAADLVDAADRAMYRVKETGRNNVARFGSAEADGSA